MRRRKENIYKVNLDKVVVAGELKLKQLEKKSIFESPIFLLIVTQILSVFVTYIVLDKQFEQQKQMIDKQFDQQQFNLNRQFEYQIKEKDIDKKENILIEAIEFKADYLAGNSMTYDRLVSLISKISVQYDSEQVQCFIGKYVKLVNKANKDKKNVNEFVSNLEYEKVFNKLEKSMRTEIINNKLEISGKKINRKKINSQTCE